MIDAPILPPTVAEPEAPSAPAIRACLVRLAGSPFGVDVASAREVALFDELTIVPRGPAHLLGVANLRGSVMPIVDIRPLLGLPAPPPGRSITTLVIEEDGVRVAVIVEAALGLEPFARIVPAGRTDLGDRASFTPGFLPWGEQLVPLLDAPRILDALTLGTTGQPDAAALQGGSR